MSKFISIKERHPHPKYTQEIAQKVTDCTNKTVVALEQSECSAIQKDFQACLETGQRVHHKCAKQFKESLEVCTANHIGQLDAWIQYCGAMIWSVHEFTTDIWLQS